MRIGWIGTGVMGASMCGHLLDAGYEVAVFNRTMARAKPLIEKGAKAASSPKEAAAGSDAVFLIVGYPKDVEEVVFGHEGVLNGLKNGSVIVDMTTSSPALARKIYDTANKMGIGSLDAPVSGGDIGAREGTLSIMAGGEREVFDRVKPLLEILGSNVRYMGPAGSGQHTKMANQILIASTMVGAVEALLYAKQSGLDPSEVIEAIGKGAAGSWTINNLGPRIIKRDFDPGFYIEHFIKDLGIALEEAKGMNISLPGLHMARQFYLSTQDLGYEKLGTQALALLYEKINES